MTQCGNERLYRELNRIAYNTLAENALLGGTFRNRHHQHPTHTTCEGKPI